MSTSKEQEEVKNRCSTAKSKLACVLTYVRHLQFFFFCHVQSLLSSPAEVDVGFIDRESSGNGFAVARATASHDNDLAFDGEKLLQLEGNMLFGHDKVKS